MKCIDAALSPLRQAEVCFLNYLDNLLILAQLEVELNAHRAVLLSHLQYLGPCQELIVPQRANHLPGSSV